MSIIHAQCVTCAAQLVALDLLASLSVQTFTTTGVSTSSSAGYRFATGGLLQSASGVGQSNPTGYSGLQPNYNGSNGGTGLDVRLTVVSGSGPNGGSLAANTWYALGGSHRKFFQTVTSALATGRTGVWRFEIRSGSTILATSADVTITALIDVL